MENAEQETTEVPSLRDSLSQAWDSQNDSAPEVEVSPADGQEAAPEESTAVEESTTVEDEPEKVFDPPQHWSEEDRTAFSKLDDDAKGLVLGISKNWESGLNRKMEELAEQRKRYAGFESFAESIQGLYPQATKEQIVKAVTEAVPTWFNTYTSMQKDPVGTLARLADSFNVSDKLSEALLGQDNDESARFKRQREAELEAEVARLRAEAQNRAKEQAESEIAKFRDATGADGKPLHPWFNELEPHMAKLIQTGAAQSLEKAYEMALKTEKYEELAKAEREKAKAELEAERRKKVNALRKPTKPTIGKSSGNGVAQPKPKSLRDQLSENWDELSTRQ